MPHLNWCGIFIYKKAYEKNDIICFIILLYTKNKYICIQNQYVFAFHLL